VCRSGSILERYSTFATRIDHPCDLRGNREISRSTLGHVAKYPRSELAVLRGWPRASPRFVSVRACVRETVEYTDTRARRQRVCQFSSLSLRERRPGSSDVRENSSWIGNDGAVGEGWTRGEKRAVQRVFGDSCQVNVSSMSKPRSERRHSAGRIEILYSYMAIYLSNGRLTRILVIVNERFPSAEDPIESRGMDS